jgi:hypothetical protein
MDYEVGERETLYWLSAPGNKQSNENLSQLTVWKSPTTKSQQTMRQARKQDNEQINVPLKVNKYIVNK